MLKNVNAHYLLFYIFMNRTDSFGRIPFLLFNPTQPSLRNRRISSLRLTGLGMGGFFLIQTHPIHDRQAMPQLQSQQNPILQCRLQD